MSINKSYSYTSSSITKRHLAERGGEIKDTVVPVSYTHLTLPTIYSV